MTAAALVNLSLKGRSEQLIRREEIIGLLDESNKAKYKKLTSIQGSSL